MQSKDRGKKRALPLIDLGDNTHCEDGLWPRPRTVEAERRPYMPKSMAAYDAPACQ